MAAKEERRGFRRLRLRLAVTEFAAGQSGGGGTFWTRDVSAGGMCLEIDADAAPREGQDVTFELRVPPGGGYSSTPSLFRGAGTVVRADRPGRGRPVRLGISFTRPPALRLD